jgi:putative oxidoreductase
MGGELMAVSPAVSDVAFLLGRGLFALVVGYLALGNLLDLDSAVAYARSKGAPLAAIAVPLGSLGLIAGALSILAGVYPAVGVLAILVFLVPITVIMHDFWTMEGEARQNEQVHFLKNVGLIGTALVFLVVPATGWPLAVGVGVGL